MNHNNLALLVASYLFSLVAFTALVACQEEYVCGTPKSGGSFLAGAATSHHIVGGSDATPGLLPWTLSIEVTEDDDTFELLCGAVLIDPSFALTSARCVQDIDP